MSNAAVGKKTWLIPDAYWDSHSTGLYPSHESVCVLNPSDDDAVIDMTFYFEDQEPLSGYQSFCSARRTHHIRLDKLKSVDGRSVPQDVPYAIVLQSSIPVVVQYSRLVSAQPELGFMSTLAYPVLDG